MDENELEELFKATNTAEPLSEGWPGLLRFGRAVANRCADTLSINRPEAQLMAGEMTAGEWRTLAAVLKGLQSRMRSNVELTGAARHERE